MGACFALDLPGHQLPGRPARASCPTRPKSRPSSASSRSLLVGAGSPFHYLVQVSTALLLVLAANTAFADFPRLAEHPGPRPLRAAPLPVPRRPAGVHRRHRPARRLSRLLIVAFGGSVTNLIPLYTVGVFVAFTLSQSGMVRHWWKLRDEEPGWRWRAAINGVGAVTTGIVAIEVGISKFALGAWMVLVLVPLLIGMMWAIRQHYRRLEGARRPRRRWCPRRSSSARSCRSPTSACRPARRWPSRGPWRADDAHVVGGPRDRRRGRAPRTSGGSGASWEPGVELVIIESPFRSLTGPLLAYIDALRRAIRSDTITVVLPEYVPPLVGAPAAQPDGAAAQGGAAVPPGRGRHERAVPHGEQTLHMTCPALGELSL